MDDLCRPRPYIQKPEWLYIIVEIYLDLPGEELEIAVAVEAPFERQVPPVLGVHLSGVYCNV
jgi:hypothetical protein